MSVQEHGDVNMLEQSASSWSSEQLSDSDADQEYGMQDSITETDVFRATRG